MEIATKRGINPLALILILSAVFFVLFIGISGAIFFTKGPGSGKSLFSSGSIGIIELNGVIMDSKKILRQLEHFEEADEIKAVVLRLNSPGGAVAPSQEIYQKVKKYKKPLIVSMDSVAASGAFYIACGAQKVYANPGTITGSIGVIMQFANLEKLYEWAKVKRFSIKTGKFKDAGAEYRDMTAEERALLQGMVDDVLLQFKEAVADGRHLSMAAVTAIADGRILSGTQAKTAKLVDELGSLQDAVDEAAKTAHLKGKPHVVYPEKPSPKLIDYILDNGRGGDEDSESSQTPSRIASLIQGIFGATTEVKSLESRVFGPAPGMYWLWGDLR